MVEPRGDLGGKQVLCSGRYVRLICDDTWEYAERIRASGVVAIVPAVDDRIILVEQFRKAVDARVIDLPAGLVGDSPKSHAEDFEIAARRELREETGYEAAELTYLAACPSSPGLTAEVITMYLAAGLKRVGPGGGDDSEQIEVHDAPLATIDDWLETKARAGVLIDPKVYAGLYFLTR